VSTAPVRTFPDTTEAPNTEPRWELLERLLASPQLRRSARLREFLLFVAQRSLQEGCTKIYEQEIGASVFGRRKNYDTSADNIVRVNATELRKRIESYFESDGAHEPLVLEIPRGSYIPVFRSRRSYPIPLADAEPQLAAVGSQEAPQLHLPRPKHLFFLLSGSIIVILGIVCAVLWTQNRRLRQAPAPWGSTPVLGAFWSEILNANPETDVVFADTSFALLEDITQKPISLNDYLNRSYLDQLQSEKLSADRKSDLNLIVSRNFGSVGDFRVAQRIMALDPTARKYHLFYAREYAPTLIKQNNVILIGGRKSNPWVDLFEDRMNFVIQYDPNTFTSSIKNRTPAAGEQQIYLSPHTPRSSVGYSIVAYMPNTGQTGKALIIEGTGSQATEAAGDFLTSESQLSLLKKKLGVRKLPYFEVLLETRLVNGTPMETKIVAYRTYPG
jgi:hypothetical protein